MKYQNDVIYSCILNINSYPANDLKIKTPTLLMNKDCNLSPLLILFSFGNSYYDPPIYLSLSLQLVVLI